jgi:hypothetical protein
MHEHEVGGDGAVYDHESEDPRGARRRRPVADWGVGEELFDHMPSRRRFARAGEPARRESHPRERQPGEAREHAVEPAAATMELTREPGPVLQRPAPRGGAEDGRRTIVIGRTTAVAARPPRPARSVGERIGHRPDRIASWAVALGMLLIVIAFATAS